MTGPNDYIPHCEIRRAAKTAEKELNLQKFRLVQMAGFCWRPTYCSGQIARDQHDAPVSNFSGHTRVSF